VSIARTVCQGGKHAHPHSRGGNQEPRADRYRSAATVRICRDHIDAQNWDYLHAYTDRAISGATALRPAYQALLEDARRGQFDIVVAEALDRLSRDQEDIAGLYKRLRFVGVRLVTLAEGEIAELHIGLKGTMNALFLKDLADKTRRGLEGRVREGRSGGGLCFGYDVVREHDARGEPGISDQITTPCRSSSRPVAIAATAQSP
jgi:DNA invertase Pin-like site-specific DNA recombinase